MRQQEFDAARKLFPRALEEGKLVEYLGGFPGYDLFNPYADSPTDPNAAFRPIGDQILEDRLLQKQVFDALGVLANDPEYGWMAIYYLSELKHLEKLHNAELVTTDLVTSIADGLRKNKANWDMNAKWVGQAAKGGLWGVVQGVNEVLTHKYKLTPLPEEL